MTAATLTRPLLHPLSPAAVAYVYAALDHVLTNPDLHDESVLVEVRDGQTVACYGARIVLCADYPVNELGDVLMEDLPQWLQDDVREALDDGDAVDPEYPRRWVDVSDLVQVMLGIDGDLTEALFNVPTNRLHLCRVVRRTFGPRPSAPAATRPLTDDGALSMTPAEVEAELARDPLGRLVHVVTVPGGARSCGAETGQAVDFADFLRVTCPRCEEHLRVIAARLLITLAFTADEPSLAELDMVRDIEKTLGRN